MGMSSCMGHEVPEGLTACCPCFSQDLHSIQHTAGVLACSLWLSKEQGGHAGQAQVVRQHPLCRSLIMASVHPQHVGGFRV